jgi:hypothetical protein
MNEVIGWIGNNWGTITIVALILIQVSNIVTRHYGEKKGIGKFFSMVTELLSVVTSRGVSNGQFGKLKLPFQSVKGNSED